MAPVGLESIGDLPDVRFLSDERRQGLAVGARPNPEPAPVPRQVAADLSQQFRIVFG